MTEPKVTLDKWKERVNANRNSGVVNTQPDSNVSHDRMGDGSLGSTSTTSKGSGNPLHPDVGEEISRIRETVTILSRQIYGGATGSLGIAKHVQELDDYIRDVDSSTKSLTVKFNDLSAKLEKLSKDFNQLLEILGVEEDSANSQ